MVELSSATISMSRLSENLRGNCTGSSAMKSIELMRLASESSSSRISSRVIRKSFGYKLSHSRFVMQNYIFKVEKQHEKAKFLMIAGDGGLVIVIKFGFIVKLCLYPTLKLDICCNLAWIALYLR